MLGGGIAGSLSRRAPLVETALTLELSPARLPRPGPGELGTSFQ